jgi:hypothetical protein
LCSGDFGKVDSTKANLSAGDTNEEVPFCIDVGPERRKHEKEMRK